MRLYQDHYKWLKSFYNEGRQGNFVFSSDRYLSTLDRNRFCDGFLLWNAFTYDRISLLSDTYLFSDCKRTFIWLFSILKAGYPLDTFFKLLKECTLLTRREANLGLWKQTFDSYPIVGEALRDIIRIPLAERKTVNGFSALHSIVSFLSKIYLENADLQEQGLKDWFLHETYLKQLTPVSQCPHYVDVEAILDDWLGDWTPDDLDDGYYTSGSTADAGRDLYAKIHHPAISEELGLLLMQYPALLEKGPSLVVKDYVFYSKWIQVPKNALSLREIAMETAALNYWQSSLDDSLRREMRKTPLGRICSFEDQWQNRLLALEGSKYGNLATVDLSKASDSVRLDHLNLFPYQLRVWLSATRSPVTLVGDELVFLNKFAPMGSRLTFDVEQILFASLGWLAEARAGIPEEYRRLSVVGDDIVIESSAYDDLLNLLDEFGFTVNTDKSYSSGGFRESCGTFAFKGVDITEPSLPRKPFNDLNDPDSDTCSWLSALADYAFYTNNGLLRYCCLRSVMSVGTPWFRGISFPDISLHWADRKPKEWMQRGYYSMLSPAPSDWHVRRRKARPTKPDYGYGEGRLLTSRHTVNRLYDDNELYEIWLYEASRRSTDSEPSSESIRGLGVGHIALHPHDQWVSIESAPGT